MATTNMQAIRETGQGRQFPHRGARPAGRLHAGGFHRRTPADRQDAVEFTHNEVMPAAAEIEAKNFDGHQQAAPQGRRTRLDGRGYSRGLRRARDGQSDLRASSPNP